MKRRKIQSKVFARLADVIETQLATQHVIGQVSSSAN